MTTRRNNLHRNRKTRRNNASKRQNNQNKNFVWSKLPAFLFETTYEIITWVLIAIAVGGFFYFLGRDEMRRAFWSGVGLLGLILLIVAFVADRHFFQDKKSRKKEETTTETIRGNQRPYVHIPHFALLKPLISQEPINVAVSIENTGTTETIATLKDFSWQYVTDPTENALQYTGTSKAPTVIKLVPKAKYTAHIDTTCVRNEDAIKKLNDGEARLFFFGRIEYTGQGDQIYSFPFCRLYDKDVPGQLMFCDNDVTFKPAKEGAWITVQGVKLEEPLVAGQSPLLIVHIQNTGPSPALALHMATKTLLGQKIDEAKWANLIQDLTRATDDGIILPPSVPDYVHYKAKWTITQEQIDDVKDDRVFLFIIGVIDYTDAAKHSRRTTFSFQTAGKYLKEGLLRQSDTGNTAK